ncbi:MAG: glutathione S-transferase family protein, partial [Pseudomonadota bacterium]
MHLYLANKLYSSWSMRPWLIMRHVGLEFDETVIPLRREDTKERIAEVSPSGKLPVLVHDDGTRVWDSMAIISWLSDLYPDKPIWPEGIAVRGHAKAICLEMHSGFQALRQACPMNLGKRFKPRDFGADVDADVARVCALWRDTRARYGSRGPFLFGVFSAADAIYAPVV